jgi:hypothetical protein
MEVFINSYFGLMLCQGFKQRRMLGKLLAEFARKDGDWT